MTPALCPVCRSALVIGGDGGGDGGFWWTYARRGTAGLGWAGLGPARLGGVRRGRAHGRARLGVAGRGRAWHGEVWQGMAGHGRGFNSGRIQMRTGRSSGFGKLTAEIRCWVPESTDEAIAALAALAGVSKGEYLRDVVMCHVHGRLMMVRMRQISGLNSAVLMRDSAGLTPE